MAFSNSAVTDVIATTIQSRSGELADNLENNNALLMYLRKRGNVRPFSGGNVIFEEIMYNDPNTNSANSYSGYELINTSPDSPISAAQYNITQYADSVTMSGLTHELGHYKLGELLESQARTRENLWNISD